MRAHRPIHFDLVRKFLLFRLPSSTRLAGLEVKKNCLKACVSRKGALCRQLAEFRCGVEPPSLSFALAHGSLVEQREILLTIT